MPGMPTVDDIDRLASTFQRYAALEFHGSSPRYERLALRVADRPALASPLLAARPGQRRPLLLFAAMQYLLRTTLTGHPLTAYLPTLGGRQALDAGFLAAFDDLVTGYADELRALCGTRATQTNEPLRCAALRPGFGLAARLAGGRPLALIELGTSAGLLLLPDRYAYRYRCSDGQRQQRYGRIDAPDALVLDCAVEPGGWPDPAGWPLNLVDRVGIDLAPLPATDADSATWLRSCIWPEHTARVGRLDAAIAEAVATRPRLIAGDMVEQLIPALSTVDSEGLPCVFTSNALCYLPAEQRVRLVALLSSFGARRDLAVLVNEAPTAGAELFAGRSPVAAVPPGFVGGLLTLVMWRDGRRTVEVLGRTGPHGAFLQWQPRALPSPP